jgi:DNA-binding CsgD family transcriptional regulator
MADAPTVSSVPGTPRPPVLWGRARELARVRALIDGARQGSSGALVLLGEAGIGKTALLDAAVAGAAPFARVERMVAVESEMELPYAALHQIVGGMVTHLDALPEPQRDALQVAFGLVAGTAPGPFLVGLAALGLLTEGGIDKPLLCVVDDAQWLDQASAQALAFVARRLGSERIALVLAMREISDGFADLPSLVVGPLDDHDARSLFQRSVPGAMDPRVRDRLIAEARGNPLALRELPRGLTAAEIAGSFALTGTLPLASRIEASLVAQLEPLRPPARLLLVLAAAEPTGNPSLLWAASAALGIGADSIDEVERAGMLSVGSRIEFRHPLLRAAVYRSAPPGDRRRCHAALAGAIDTSTDPDRRAWHRAQATVEPDENVASELERSAVRARTRGGGAAAAAFLERAAALTPDRSRRAERLVGAAQAKYEGGGPEAALRLLDSVSDADLPPVGRAKVARLRAQIDYALHRRSNVAEQLIAAADQLSAFSPGAAHETYLEAFGVLLFAGRLDDAGDRASRIKALGEAVLSATGDQPGDGALDLLVRGHAEFSVGGYPEPALATGKRALAAFMTHPLGEAEVRWMWLACRAALDMWDAEALRTLSERQISLARTDGALTILPTALTYGIAAKLLDGDLAAATAYADEVDVIKDATGNTLPRYGRCIVAAWRGHVDEVRARAEQLRSDARGRREGTALSAANFAEAIALNGAGRYADAVALGREELPHSGELSFAMRILPETVEAAVHAGEPEVAREAVERLAALTAPPGGDWALGALAGARAQIAEGPDAEAFFREAIERFERVAMPLLAARARLTYGEWLRRHRRRIDAREQLRAAHAILSVCGADGFAARAAIELSATGETTRPRTADAVEALTAQERNVARLARDGLTNRDIGTRLFISARTVEYHLRKVFMKLGISGRNELRDALADLD